MSTETSPTSPSIRTVRPAPESTHSTGPTTANTRITVHQGIDTIKSQSGRAIATIATAASRNSGIFRTTCDARMLPASAPPPNAAKRKPTIFASAP